MSTPGSSFAYNYCNAMPYDTINAAGKSFIFSFAISTAITGNPGFGLFSGVMAAAVSLVSSATVPIFREIWNRGPNSSEHWYEFAARSLLAAAVVSIIAANFANITINFIATAAFAVLISAFEGFKDRPMDKSAIYLVF